MTTGPSRTYASDAEWIGVKMKTAEQVARDRWPMWRWLRGQGWRFCTLTPGCTKEDGHKPPCTVYKGLWR